MQRKRSVAWVYDGNHQTHPFILLGINTLVAAGIKVTVIDRAEGIAADAAYAHRPLGKNAGPRSKISFIFKAFWLLLKVRPQAAIATLPTSLAAVQAAFSIIGGRKIYYPFEIYGEQNQPVRPVMKKIEIRLIAFGLEALITQNNCRARIYVEERKCKIIPTIIHNYKPQMKARQTGNLRRALNLAADVPIVLYEGQIIPGRLLDVLIQAVALLDENIHVVFLGEASCWWDTVARPLIRSLGLERRITHMPAVPYDELIEYIVDVNAGVILYDPAVRNNLYCEPGKLSDYVLAGVPICCPDYPTIGHIIQDYGIGKTFKTIDAHSIASTLTEIISQSREEWTKSIAKVADRFTWETQAAAFLAAVQG